MAIHRPNMSAQLTKVTLDHIEYRITFSSQIHVKQEIVISLCLIYYERGHRLNGHKTRKLMTIAKPDQAMLIRCSHQKNFMIFKLNKWTMWLTISTSRCKYNFNTPHLSCAPTDGRKDCRSHKDCRSQNPKIWLACWSLIAKLHRISFKICHAQIIPQN